MKVQVFLSHTGPWYVDSPRLALFFYAVYMLFSKWDSTKFVSLVQILLGLYSASVIVSCILFIMKTNLFGPPGAVGVHMALFISLPLIFVLQLVKKDLRVSPRQG